MSYVIIRRNTGLLNPISQSFNFTLNEHAKEQWAFYANAWYLSKLAWEFSA